MASTIASETASEQNSITSRNSHVRLPGLPVAELPRLLIAILPGLLVAECALPMFFLKLTSAEYQHLFDTLVPQGYRVTYARGFNFNGQARFDVEMQQISGADWVTYHGMTDCGFREKSTHYFQSGYQMTHHSAYRVPLVLQSRSVATIATTKTRRCLTSTRRHRDEIRK